MAINDPTDISGCVLWLDPGTISATDGDPVGSWSDQSGNGNDAAAAGSDRPTYRDGSDYFHGQPNLEWSSNAHRLDVPADASLDNGEVTYVIVIRQDDTRGLTGPQDPLWLINKDNTNPATIGIRAADEPTAEAGFYQTFFRLDGSEGTVRQNVSRGPQRNAWSVLVFTYDGSAGRLYVNNQLSDTTSIAGAIDTDNSGILSIGNHVSVDNGWSGRIGEVIVYDNAISTSDRNDLHSWLFSKYPNSDFIKESTILTSGVRHVRIRSAEQTGLTDNNMLVITTSGAINHYTSSTADPHNWSLENSGVISTDSAYRTLDFEYVSGTWYVYVDRASGNGELELWTGSDLSSLSEHGSSPVITGSAGDHPRTPAVIHESGSWTMLLDVRTDALLGGVGYLDRYTSSDGVSWTKDAVNSPVVSPQGNGFEATDITHPHIFKRKAGSYLIAYAGYNDNHSLTASYFPHEIGFLESTDLINFTRSNKNPVLTTRDGSSQFDQAFVSNPCLFKTDAEMTLYYSGGTVPSISIQAGYALGTKILVDGEDTLALTQDAASVNILQPDADSTIALTDSAVRVTPIISVGAESTLSITDVADDDRFLLSAESTISLTQDETVAGPKTADATTVATLSVTTDFVSDTFGRVSESSISVTQEALSSIKNVLAITPDPQSDDLEIGLSGFFTSNWTSEARLAETLELTAETIISLAQTLPQPTGIRSVESTTTIVFLDVADTNTKSRALSNTLVLQTTADVEKILTTESVLTLTTTVDQGFVNLDAENTLNIQQAVRPNPDDQFAVTDIDIDGAWSQVATSSIKMLDANNLIDITDSINVIRPWRVDAESEISGVTDDVFIPPAGPIIPGVPFGLSQEATVSQNPVRNPLSLINISDTAEVVRLKSTAIDLTASTIIGLTDQANLSLAEEATTLLTFTVSSDANLNTTDALTTIDGLLDMASISISRAETPAESVIPLKHAVGFSLVRDTTKCDYTPFVSESDAGTTPPRPTLPEPRVPELPGVRFRLVYPPFDTGVTVDQIDLRAPEFGNRERLEVTRIQRETTGGTLIVFADPVWPKVHTLTMTFAALKTSQARGLLNFIERWVGQEIGLYDYEGRVWKGIITNPDEAVTQDGRESFSASLEIEAERVHQLNHTALSNLGVTDLVKENESFALSTIIPVSQADYDKFPVAPGGSGIDISDSADYTIIPAGPVSSMIAPTQFAARNSFFYESAESSLILNSVGASLDFDDFGNLIHNWDAENTSGLSDTDPVVSLSDLGSNPIALNSTAGLRPIVRDSVLNGRRVIEFRHSGGSQRLLSASNIPVYDLANKTSTIFIVMIVREVLSAGNEVIIGNNTDKLMLGGSTSTQRPVALLSSEGTVALETPTSVLGNGSTQLLVLRRNGNNVLFRRNKTTEDGTTFSTNPTPGDEQLYVGGFSGAGNSVDQDIAQVLFYDDALSINDIQTIEGLLSAKWGV